MCRSISEGGRRCPSHNNSEKIAAYNAIRRLRYNAKKNNIITSLNEYIISCYGEPGFIKKDNSTIIHEDLELTETSNEGILIDKKYFCEKNFSGVLNYDNINDSTYKTLGFNEVQDGVIKFNKAYVGIDALSEIELKPLSTEERRAATFFTSMNYVHFNKAVYSGVVEPSFLNQKSYLEQHKKKHKDDELPHPLIPEKEFTKELVTEMASTLDKALSNSPKQQRMVYRGVSAFSKIDGNKITGKEWIKNNNIIVGGEFITDGYTSASMSAEVAEARYSSDEGIVFQILTSEGLSVSSVSAYPSEKEIILPRGARYTVVGVHDDVKINRGMNKYTIVQLVAINDKGEILDGSNHRTPLPISFNS